jgi:hypothetical protein
MNPIWRFIKGIGILTLLIVLLCLIFKYIDLYGAYLKWIGVTLVITFLIIVCVIAIVSAYRMFKNFFKHPPSSGALT